MTSVGGGEFSSPVTVSLREQPSDNTEQPSAPASSSNTNQAGLIAGVTVSVIVLLGLLMAAITTELFRTFNARLIQLFNRLCSVSTGLQYHVTVYVAIGVHPIHSV